MLPRYIKIILRMDEDKINVFAVPYEIAKPNGCLPSISDMACKKLLQGRVRAES